MSARRRIPAPETSPTRSSPIPPTRGRSHEWGHTVGASSRTLARAFLSDTGLSFGRWRTLVRLQASLPHLAEQVPVSAVARLVGYRTTSAYVAAFRAHTGVTPGRYFQPPSAPYFPKRPTGDVPVEDLGEPVD